MIAEKIKDTEETKAAYLKLVKDDASFGAVQAASGKHCAARDALIEAIVDGAKPCPSCGAKPHGMIQNWSIEKQLVVGFEIGCLNCFDHCAVGFLAEDLAGRREAAVKHWNAGPEKWFQVHGALHHFTLDAKSGDVSLVVDDADGKQLDAVSCKVAAPGAKEIAAYAATLRAGEGDEAAAKDEAARELFQRAIAARNARVTTFRQKHGID